MKRVDNELGCCRCDAPPPNWMCSLCGEVCCLASFRSFGNEPVLPFCNECIDNGFRSHGVMVTDAQRSAVWAELRRDGEIK